MKTTLYHTFAGIVAAFIAAVFAFTILIYGFGWNNAVIRAAARFVPWPAAIVEGKVITLHEFYSSDKGLDALIENEVENILARKMRVQGGDGALAVALLRQKEESETYQRANELLRRIRFGEDFVNIARESSEDEETKYIGGDLGLVAESKLDPWFQEAAAGLKPGEISGIVITPEGYNILMLVSRTEDGYVHLRRILVRDESWRDAVAVMRQGMRIYVFKGL